MSHVLSVWLQSYIVDGKLRMFLLKTLVNANDFAINIVMVINIAIHKTFSIYNLVNKLFIATTLSIQCFNVHTGMYG